MKLKRIAAMLTAAVMAVSLAACGGNTGTNTESSQNPKENAEAQAVHLNLAESWGFEYFYTILTPEVSSSSYDITYYLTSFYDTLFEYNSEGEVVGVLAEDWSMSEDGKTYTFQIKQGVKFSDGSDLTAEDVAKSILAVPVNLGQYNGSYGRLSTIIEDAVPDCPGQPAGHGDMGTAECDFRAGKQYAGSCGLVYLRHCGHVYHCVSDPMAPVQQNLYCGV